MEAHTCEATVTSEINISSIPKFLPAPLQQSFYYTQPHIVADLRAVYRDSLAFLF